MISTKMREKTSAPADLSFLTGDLRRADATWSAVPVKWENGQSSWLTIR